MFRNYMLFKWKDNNKVALCIHKDNLNKHIDFISSNLKSLDWYTLNEEELEEYGIDKEEVLI